MSGSRKSRFGQPDCARGRTDRGSDQDRRNHCRVFAAFGDDDQECVNRAYETSLAEGLLFERRTFHAVFATEDQKEGWKPSPASVRQRLSTVEAVWWAGWFAWIVRKI